MSLTFTINGFDPPWAVHPGEVLKEVLDEAGMTQVELARRCGVSQKHISEIVNGKAGIGPDFAVRLEDVTRVAATFWVRMQAGYDVRLARERRVAA